MLIILDKDGTIVTPASGEKFPKHPEDQKLIPGVDRRIAELKTMDATIVLASNHGEVSAGYKSLGDAIAEMRYALKLTGIENGYLCPCNPSIIGSYCLEVMPTRINLWCDPAIRYKRALIAHCKSQGWDFYEVDASSFRDSYPGMLRLACAQSWRNHKTIVMVGDRPEDEQAAQNAQVKFQWADDWISNGLRELE